MGETLADGMETQHRRQVEREPAERSCLRVEGLSKTFAGLEALSQVTLEVRTGERRAIIGPNGAGKTTLFNLISGELQPTAGRIFLRNRDVTHLSVNRRAHLGISRTFQITNLFPRLTVMQNLILAAQALEGTKFAMLRPLGAFSHLHRKAGGILERIGLLDKRDEEIRNLSHGEQRQIEVAMALLGEPQVLLLDEPSAGLASAESAMMVSLLKSLDRSIAILLIEHDMDVAFEVSDQVTVLNTGRVLVQGTKDEIRSNAAVQEIYFGAK